MSKPKLKVEYAKSNRSKCRISKDVIPKGSVRLGKLERSQKFDGEYYVWHIPREFKKKHAAMVTCDEDLSNLQSLKWEDQEKLRKLFGLGGSKKRKRGSADDEEDAEAAARQAERKKRTQALWKNKKKLEKDYTKEGLRGILRYNKQYYKGTNESDLQDRVAMYMLDGGLPMCPLPKCTGGYLKLSGDNITCSGYLSAWSKCTYVCTLRALKSKRPKLVIPSDDDIDEQIEELEIEKEKLKQEKEEGAMPVSKKTLEGSVFLFIGTWGSGYVKKDIKAAILEAGGKVQTKLNDDVTYCLTTYTVVKKKKKTKVLQGAMDRELPLLDPDFVDFAIDNGSVAQADEFRVWVNDKATPVDTDSIVSKAPTREKRKMAIPAIDKMCEYVEAGEILTDNGEVYAISLNVTDLGVGSIGQNSFYILQVIKLTEDDGYCVFKRWGRVGQDGNTSEKIFYKKKAAIKFFKTTFFEKTLNHWESYVYNEFEKKPGKLFPVELDFDDSEDEEDEEKKERIRELMSKTKCGLPKRTQDLIKLIFNKEMLEDTMKELDLDIKKMPLGKLSKNQIDEGYEILEEIEEMLENGDDKNMIHEASNRFYTKVPHDFGVEARPPAIDDKELLQQKYDLLDVLGDIEKCLKMMESEGKSVGTHPMEEKYKQLKNNVKPIPKNGDEWTRIEKYLDLTRETWNLKILDIYSLDRHGETERLEKYQDVEKRKLLWHGSNVAVFASILSGGVRIMPHSGGRVGKGLYFADMISKSAGYCTLHGKVGLVLLNEVVLGKINRIYRDRSDFKHGHADLKGYNSVLASGTIEPSESKDFIDKDLSKSGHPVSIPQGKPGTVKGRSSSFRHNEYLVYDEAQVAMKYLLMLEWQDRIPSWH